MALCKNGKLCCDNLNDNYACHFTTSKYTFIKWKKEQRNLNVFCIFKFLLIVNIRLTTSHVDYSYSRIYFQESFIQVLLWEDGNKHRLAIFIISIYESATIGK